MDHNPPPLISIIVAVFNVEKTLQQCIDSIVNQTYQNKELIIIDGDSTDGTVDLLKANLGKITYWVSEPDRGIFDAWNKGLKHSTGDWVAFLGADDTYLPDALQIYVDYIIANQNIKFEYVSSRVNLVNGDKLIRTIGRSWNWNSFRRYMNVAHVGSLHNKTLYEKYGTYNTACKICADYEMLLRPKAKLIAGFVNTPTVNMSIGGASDSALALREAMLVKAHSGGRSAVMCRLEYGLALFKLSLRKKLWY
jgi:glycosyltransferase involved in cell wall biosynthesis